MKDSANSKLGGLSYFRGINHRPRRKLTKRQLSLRSLEYLKLITLKKCPTSPRIIEGAGHTCLRCLTTHYFVTSQNTSLGSSVKLSKTFLMLTELK